MSPVCVRLYQIAYSPDTRAACEPGYAVLDNLANPRPDWYEYWPIRRFLLESQLDESAFYGFFSPKFASKTGWSHAQVSAFIQEHAATTDVFLFSPQPDMGAFFLNVFEQGETFDRGLLAAYSDVLQRIGRPIDLRGLVMDSRQIVYSNYFVAKPAFWREWLFVNEAIFAICEGAEDDLQRTLTAPTTYPGQAQRKVFVQERTASYLLATQAHWRTQAANPFRMAWSNTRMKDYPLQAFMSDALKMAFREQRFPEYMTAFNQLREEFISRGAAPPHRAA